MHTLNPLSRLLTVPYIWAQRILHLARGVEVFHMQSMHIARQALHLVVLLNDLIDEMDGPDDEQHDERINLGDELVELEEAMRKWGAAAGVHQECAERVSVIKQHYARFFKPRFYFDAGSSSDDMLLKRLLAYDMKTLAFEQRQPSSAIYKGIIPDIVKRAMRDIRKNNVSNPHTARLWSRRVIDIAIAIECSSDKEKTGKLDQLTTLVTTVAAEFADDYLQARTGPDVFLKRQKVIIQADAQLNEFMPPPSNRDVAMKEAVEKDLKKLDKNLRDICESSLPLLQSLCDILPRKKALKAADMSDNILEGQEAFSMLRVAMAEVNDRIANFQESGLVAPSMRVAIRSLDDPDANPVYQPCSREVTFGELLETAFVTSDEGGKCEDEDEDEPIPDVWIKRWDPKHNSVTEIGQWWEPQDNTSKIQDVFKTAAGDPEKLSQEEWCVEIVAKKGDYIIALVNEEGKERGKVLDFPTSKKAAMHTRDHLQTVFANHEVAKVLDLQSGKDVSQTMFHSLNFSPRTNPLYVELRAVSNQQVTPLPPQNSGKNHLELP